MRRAALWISLALMALVCVAWATEPAPTVLDDEAFRFCHETRDFRFNDSFCPLLEGLPEDRCVGLREYCAAPEDAPKSGCNEQVPSSGPLSTPAGAPEQRPVFDPTIPQACDFQAPSLGVGNVLMWVVAFVVAFGIAAVLVFLLRFIGWRRDTPATPTVAMKPLEDDEQDFAEAVSEVPDLPSEDLLQAAKVALADQRLGDAAVLARGAVLRELGERRVLKLHRARTDREYVRQSGNDSDLGEVLNVAELHRWGRTPLTVDRVQAALVAAARLLAATLVLVFATAAHAQGLDRFGPRGDAGLQRVFEKHGIEAGHRLRSLDEPGEDVDVIVLDTSGVAPKEEDWEALREWVEAGHVLMVAGNPVGFPELGELVSAGPSVRVHPDLAAEGLPTPRFSHGAGAGFDGGEPWVVSDGGAPVVAARVGEGAVLAIGDPILLWNGSLVDPVNEAFLGEVLYRGQARGWPMDSPIRVQLATVSGSSNNPAEALMNLRLLPLVLQVLVFWIALVVWRGWLFAPARDGSGEGRQAFSEHVEAVARQYQALGAKRHVASAYAAWALERYHRAGLLLQAKRQGMGTAEAKALVDRIEAAAETPEGPSDPSDLDFLEEVWKLTRRH